MTHGDYKPSPRPPPSDLGEDGPPTATPHPRPPATAPPGGTKTREERALYEEAAHVTKRIRVLHPKTSPVGYCAPLGGSIRLVCQSLRDRPKREPLASHRARAIYSTRAYYLMLVESAALAITRGAMCAFPPNARPHTCHSEHVRCPSPRPCSDRPKTLYNDQSSPRWRIQASGE